MLLPFAYTQGSQLIIVSNTLICGVEPVEAWVRQGISSGVNKCFRLLLAKRRRASLCRQQLRRGLRIWHSPSRSRSRACGPGDASRARNVIVISDANRFGQGFLPLRILKLLLFKLKLWSAFDF